MNGPVMLELAAVRAALESVRCENAVMKREVASVRREMRDHTELLDTLATPPWKRVWFFLRGYRLWRLGVWYRAVWNTDAHGNEDRRRAGMERG